MSVEQVEQSILQLSAAEQRQFARWFYEHEDKLAGLNEINPEVKAEILRRRDEAEAHPELLEPWEGTAGRVRAQLHELRNKKVPAR